MHQYEGANPVPLDNMIVCVQISPQLEGEEMGVDLPGFKRGDRTDIELPAVQREMIKALHDAGKKVIFVNCSGSPIAMEDDTVLGAHVLGNPASEIITLASMAVELKLTASEWKKMVFPHPTVGEIFKEAL